MTSRIPFLTALIILANLLVFRLELSGDGMALCHAFGLVPAHLMSSGDLTPLFSSLFLHDPETLLHLGCNMAVLAVFGPIVEHEVGSFRFLVLYAAAGAAGGLLHVVVDPGATEPLVGASGAIFGVLAVAGALRPRLLGFAVALAGVEVSHALFGGAGNASFGAHIGGFAMGALFAAAARPVVTEELAS